MNGDFLTLLFAGITLGFSSGITPGPLLALTISETLRYGMKSGLKVAVAPLITDTPIVIGAILILTEVKELSYSLAIMSLIGSLFLAYFGYENLRAKLSLDSVEESKISSLQKAIIANILNPNPYLFWVTIGGPLFLSGVSISVWNGIVFYFLSNACWSKNYNCSCWPSND